MPILNDVVKFNIARLFNGAIDVDWIVSDPEKAKMVSEAFVFHGPAYHGVSQKDIASTGHRLIDSASFFKNVLDNLVNDSGQPFTLAIAGFGSGKSHIALTLSQLLESNDDQLQNKIIDNIAEADESIAAQTRKTLSELAGRTLVITLNGMNNFDLSAEILSQAKNKLQALNISTEPLEELRKRFTHAASILKNFDSSLLNPLMLELDISDESIIFDKLAAFDETIYARVHDFLQSLGIPLKAIGDETAKDVLKQIVSQYVGDDKPFSKVLILFDEFGRYLEFATTKSQIAGNGALQQLYEGVQENSGKLSFVGFIQYELKAYEQRLPAEFKNDIRRFITRFQSSEKLYLSINLETLIAHLLIKNSKAMNFDADAIKLCFEQLQNWYPDARNHSLWNTEDRFARVIGQGCWPLSPLAVWLLFHLSAGGQYLQQRSALSLLKTALEDNAEFEFTESCTTLPPVRLWTSELQSEFLDVEEQSGHNAIVQSYQTVYDKHRQHLSTEDILTLRSIVLTSITRLKATSRKDAVSALSAFSGIAVNDLEAILSNLEEELNIVSWDESFHQFDIIGDSVSKSQFLKFLRHKIATEYDSEQQEKLFVQKSQLIPDHIRSVECDFANEQKILSSEWIFDNRPTYWSIFQRLAENMISQHMDSVKFCQVDTPRGIIFYCFVPENEAIEDVKLQAQSILRKCAKQTGYTHIPVILALLHDSGEIGKIMSEMDIIEKLSPQENELYGKIASIHREKRIEALKEEIKQALLQRNFVSTFTSDTLPTRLTQIANSVFEKIYSKVLPFPFDGYRSNRTNAAVDCGNFTRLLLSDDFSYSKVQTMPQRQQNRANSVLKEAWKIFNKDGSINAQPAQTNARAIIMEWDKLLYGNQEGLNCASAMEIACAPPYGANIASAGLLFSVYVQTRKNIILAEENGQHTDWQTMLGRLFDNNLFSIKALSAVNLFKTENDDSEWDQLLNDWGNACSYAARIEFAAMANDLETRIQIPRTIKWKAQELHTLADEAQRKIDEFDEKEEKAFNIIERAKAQDDIFNLSYGASLLQSCGKKKTDDPMWRQEDYSYLADHIITAKQTIIQNFESWLVQQRPANRSQAALAEFRSILIDKMGRNLKELDLKAQQAQIEQYYTKISKSFEQVAECQQALISVDTWLANYNTFSQNISLTELKTLQESLIAHGKLLTKSKQAMSRLQNVQMIGEIEEKITTLLELKRKLELHKRKIEDNAKAIWESELSPQTGEELNSRLLELEHLYSGSSRDVEDFRNMRSVTEFYIDSLHKLQYLGISTADFKTQVKTTKETFLSRFAEYELPWDLESAFSLLQETCEAFRQNAATDWLCSIQERLSDISTMTIAQGNELLSDLDTPPQYVDIDANKKLFNNLKQKIEHFLDTKEIEWLLERVKKMSPTAKAEFINALKEL